MTWMRSPALRRALSGLSSVVWENPVSLPADRASPSLHPPPPINLPINQSTSQSLDQSINQSGAGLSDLHLYQLFNSDV